MATNTFVHAHALYGSPVTSQRSAYAHPDAHIAPASAPYIDPREFKCVGKDNTCGANKVRGGELCLGHQRQADALARVSANIANGV